MSGIIGGGYSKNQTGMLGFSHNDPSFVAVHEGGITMHNETWHVFGDTIKLNKGGCYNATTYKFQPTIPGYYYLHCSLTIDDVGDGKSMSAGIFKNASLSGDEVSGTPVRARDMRVGSGSGAKGINVSTVEYANGSSDYFYFCGYHANISPADRSFISNQYNIALGYKV